MAPGNYMHALTTTSALTPAQQTPVDAQKQQEPVEKSASFVNSVRSVWASMRRGAIAHTPSFIVNNSSNFLGAAHVGTEMMMFKASNKNGRLIKGDIHNPINWIKDPLITVFEDTFKRSQSETIPFGELLKGNPFKNIYKRITDVEAATERVRTSPANVGKALSEIKMANPWQTRSTLAGLLVWSISALIPEKRDSEDEIERMSIKRRTNPVGYVGERIGQALWVPGWREHKRQMIGLGVAISGVCSAIGAWRGRFSHPATGVQNYMFNRSYLATSAITFGASLPLMFASDDQRGYGGFGGIMMLRIPFLFPSIKNKRAANEPGWKMYTASMASFQAENLAQNMIGGVEVTLDEQGNKVVTDHNAIRQQAKSTAKEMLQERKQSIGLLPRVDSPAEQPSPNITEETPTKIYESPGALVMAGRQVQKAMPEKVASHQTSSPAMPAA